MTRGQVPPEPPSVDGTLTRREALAAGLAVTGGLALGGRLGRLGRMLEHAAAVAPRGSDLGAVEHVIFVMQENRSFDHYFGTYRGVRGYGDRGPGSSAFVQNVPGLGTFVPYHLDAATVQAQCAGSADIPIHDWDPQHDSWNDGRMNQFVSSHAPSDGAAQAPLVMSYFERGDLPFYYALADAFTICDTYHCSVIGPTMPNRLYWLSATLDPSGANGGPVTATPGFGDAPAAVGSVDWTTMPEALSAHGVSWKVYQPPGTSVGANESENLATAFNALLYFKQYLADPSSDLYRRAYLPAWPSDFLADVSAGTLPSVSWICPNLLDSEHPSAAPANGMAHVSTLIQALLAKPDVWAKTVVFLSYDENGGFFDHVPPPTAPPGTPGEYLTAATLPPDTHGIRGPIGLGFRVPMIVVSPFSRGGYVNSHVFDHTSQLRFLETRFGVPVPNLTSWRRKTVGDLTSTLAFRSPDPSVPALPPAPRDSPSLAAACPDNQSVGGFFDPAPNLTIPKGRSLPRQEPGQARRR